jgi:MoaA/NifB/PqqE/SkfB family radical SAM enzyme
MGKDWVRGINRIVASEDLPVTLQGGEPSLHPDFYYIINNLKPELKIDILTNLEFDISEFITKVSPSRLKRKAPYASIRVSFHPEKMNIKVLVDKVLKLLEKEYSVGIWGIAHPKYKKEIEEAEEYCSKLGIDFRKKEFLGWYNGKLYGTYKYLGACEQKQVKQVRCKTTELLVDPLGNIYRCHSDLYAARTPIGNILSEECFIENKFRDCNYFGFCHPCDIKIKNNRFQVYGHTSVEINFETKKVYCDL